MVAPKGLAKPLSLPTKKSVPLLSMSDYVLLIYGREKIGKTSLAAQFPNSLFLMFEAGGKALDIYQMNMHTWVDFKRTLALLKDDNRFKTIVIDTIDLCYKMCLEWVSKNKLGGNHPSDESYGKGWDLLKSEFQSIIAEFCKIGKGIIFLSHETEKEIKLWKGGTYNMIAPTMSGTARAVVEPMADLFGYYYYGDGEQRYLKIIGDRESVGGTRMKEAGFFKDIDEIPMGYTPAESYKNLCAAFNNKLKVNKPSPQPSKQVLPKGKGTKKRK